jgi:hypothetical protein
MTNAAHSVSSAMPDQKLLLLCDATALGCGLLLRGLALGRATNNPEQEMLMREIVQKSAPAVPADDTVALRRTTTLGLLRLSSVALLRITSHIDFQ